MSLLLKGILIGLLFGVPVGAVGAMTVQRTWEHGIFSGKEKRRRFQPCQENGRCSCRHSR